MGVAEEPYRSEIAADHQLLTFRIGNRGAGIAGAAETAGVPWGSLAWGGLVVIDSEIGPEGGGDGILDSQVKEVGGILRVHVSIQRCIVFFIRIIYLGSQLMS